MATMPNVVGLNYNDAQTALQTAGVLVPDSIGYFGVWPITIHWIQSTNFLDTVTAQSPASSATIAANSAVILTVSQPKVSVVYP